MFLFIHFCLPFAFVSVSNVYLIQKNSHPFLSIQRIHFHLWWLSIFIVMHFKHPLFDTFTCLHTDIVEIGPLNNIHVVYQECKMRHEDADAKQRKMNVCSFHKFPVLELNVRGGKQNALKITENFLVKSMWNVWRLSRLYLPDHSHFTLYPSIFNIHANVDPRIHRFSFEFPIEIGVEK